jgi:hypothetical protein
LCVHALLAGLFSTDYQGDVEEGLKKILAFAHMILAQQERPTVRMFPSALEDHPGRIRMKPESRRKAKESI